MYQYHLFKYLCKTLLLGDQIQFPLSASCFDEVLQALFTSRVFFSSFLFCHTKEKENVIGWFSFKCCFVLNSYNCYTVHYYVVLWLLKYSDFFDIMGEFKNTILSSKSVRNVVLWTIQFWNNAAVFYGVLLVQTLSTLASAIAGRLLTIPYILKFKLKAPILN